MPNNPDSEKRQAKKNTSSQLFRCARTASRMLLVQYLCRCDSQQDWTPMADDELQDFQNMVFELDKPFQKPEAEIAAASVDVIRDQAWKRMLELAPKLLNVLPEIDKMLGAAASNWSLKRMGCLDRNIMRLGVFELRYLTSGSSAERSVSPAIAINEAVELAKMFGEHDSPRFVNGVLDSINKQRIPAEEKPADADK